MFLVRKVFGKDTGQVFAMKVLKKVLKIYINESHRPVVHRVHTSRVNCFFFNMSFFESYQIKP